MFKRGKVHFVECAVAAGCVDHHISVVRQGAAKAKCTREKAASISTTPGGGLRAACRWG